MKKLCLLSTLLCAVMMVAALPAFAQPYSPSEAAEKTYGNWKFKLSTSSNYQFETDINGGGKFELYRITGGLNVLYNFNPCTTLDTALGYEYLNYDFSDTGNGGFQVDADRPRVNPLSDRRRANLLRDSDNGYGGFSWNKVHLGTLRSVLRWRESEQWEFFGGPIITLGMEEGADWNDSIGGGLTAGFKYFHSDTLTIGAGLTGMSQFEKGEPLILPVIVLNWKFAPNWQLRNAMNDLGSKGGTGLEVAWRCIEPLELVLGAQYMRRDFRLSENGAVVDGIGQERGMPVYVMANLDVVKNVRLSVFGGGIVNGKIRVEDKNGDALSSHDYDPAPIAGARLGICF
jgi:opacity protein-like surface antigen